MTTLPSTVEVWKSIPGYAGQYEVSSLGHVRSVARVVRKTPESRAPYDYVVPARLMRTASRNGYPSVTLYRNGVKTRHSVHVIVASAFIGERPEGQFVCHIDGKRNNNAATNLRYDSPAANSQDMVRHGRSLLGRKNHLAKLNADDVLRIRSLRGQRTQEELAAEHGVSKAAIGYVQRGHTWRHIHD